MKNPLSRSGSTKLKRNSAKGTRAKGERDQKNLKLTAFCIKKDELTDLTGDFAEQAENLGNVHLSMED